MENLNKRPSKGILRFSEGSSRSNSVEKDIKWDEANIKETLHPDDKDYGFMKIDEPPTPYSSSPHVNSGENSDNDEDLKAKTDALLEKVSKKIKEPPVTIENVEALLDESDFEAIEKEVVDLNSSANGTNEALHEIPSTSHQMPCSRIGGESSRSSTSNTSASDFELKRKRHYNEFHAVKLAKKLMQKELDDNKDGGEGEDDDDDDEDAVIGDQNDDEGDNMCR